MKVTVDANILFSALIRKGKTRKIWFNPEIELYAPFFILQEFRKYKDYLRKKSGLDAEDFADLSGNLISQLLFVKDNELGPFLPAAASLHSDVKDLLYLACALKEDTIIWSNDKGFKAQQRVKILTTDEMEKEFGSL
ncbi:MAG: PIN domain-containing protein [Candidatus Diapherotrites archaeon]